MRVAWLPGTLSDKYIPHTARKNAVHFRVVHTVAMAAKTIWCNTRLNIQQCIANMCKSHYTMSCHVQHIWFLALSCSLADRCAHHTVKAMNPLIHGNNAMA